MSDPDPLLVSVPVAKLKPGETRRFDLVATAPELEELRNGLGLDGLAKLRLVAELKPMGSVDWRLSGHLGATITQACVVTLDPVKTRIEADFSRDLLAHWSAPQDSEAEMADGQEDVEPLGDSIDLAALASEIIALHTPDYPRADGVELGPAVFSEPGVAPMTDEDAKPFAGLAALRDKLGGGSDS